MIGSGNHEVVVFSKLLVGDRSLEGGFIFLCGGDLLAGPGREGDGFEGVGEDERTGEGGEDYTKFGGSFCLGLETGGNRSCETGHGVTVVIVCEEEIFVDGEVGIVGVGLGVDVELREGGLLSEGASNEGVEESFEILINPVRVFSSDVGAEEVSDVESLGAIGGDEGVVDDCLVGVGVGSGVDGGEEVMGVEPDVGRQKTAKVVGVGVASERRDKDVVGAAGVVYGGELAEDVGEEGGDFAVEEDIEIINAGLIVQK